MRGGRGRAVGGDLLPELNLLGKLQLTFDALEAARNSAAPTASLFATAMGSIQVLNAPALFVMADMALKAEERRFSRGFQQTFDFAAATVEEKLRVTTVAPNDLVTESQLAIRRNMRVR